MGKATTYKRLKSIRGFPFPNTAIILYWILSVVIVILLVTRLVLSAEPEVCKQPTEITKEKCRDLELLQANKDKQIQILLRTQAEANLAGKTLNDLTQQENDLTNTIRQLETKQAPKPEIKK